MFRGVSNSNLVLWKASAVRVTMAEPVASQPTMYWSDEYNLLRLLRLYFTTNCIHHYWIYMQSYITMPFVLDDVSVVYDTHYNLSAYTGHGTVDIKFPPLIFNVSVYRAHDAAEMIITSEFTGMNNVEDIMVRFYPDNGYTQLWTRELRKNPTFRNAFLVSIGGWPSIWQPTLTRVIESIPFPNTCYDCLKNDSDETLADESYMSRRGDRIC